MTWFQHGLFSMGLFSFETEIYVTMDTQLGKVCSFVRNAFSERKKVIMAGGNIHKIISTPALLNSL